MDAEFFISLFSGVLRGLLSRTDEWGYRIPYALQWMWPVPILVGCFFAFVHRLPSFGPPELIRSPSSLALYRLHRRPESPWWDVRMGNIAEARRTIVSLTSPAHTNFDPDSYLAMIVHTNEMEKAVSAGTSYWDW